MGLSYQKVPALHLKKSFFFFSKKNCSFQMEVYFWPFFAKPKCVWEAVDFFSSFEKVVTLFCCLFYHLSNKLPYLLNAFWFYQHGARKCTISEIQPFPFCNFSNGTPCRNDHEITAYMNDHVDMMYVWNWKYFTSQKCRKMSEPISPLKLAIKWLFIFAEAQVPTLLFS